MGIGRICRYRPAQSAQQVVDIADIIVDLRGEQPRLIDRALDRCRLITLPLLPKAEPDQGGERDDGGEHQSEQLRSNAAKQHQFAPSPKPRSCAPLTPRWLSRKLIYNWHPLAPRSAGSRLVRGASDRAGKKPFITLNRSLMPAFPGRPFAERARAGRSNLSSRAMPQRLIFSSASNRLQRRCRVKSRRSSAAGA